VKVGYWLLNTLVLGIGYCVLHIGHRIQDITYWIRHIGQAMINIRQWGQLLIIHDFIGQQQSKAAQKASPRSHLPLLMQLDGIDTRRDLGSTSLRWQVLLTRLETFEN